MVCPAREGGFDGTYAKEKLPLAKKRQMSPSKQKINPIREN